MAGPENPPHRRAVLGPDRYEFPTPIPAVSTRIVPRWWGTRTALASGLPHAGREFSNGAGLRRFGGAPRDKTNLLIFLTPHVIASDADVDRVTRHKKTQTYSPQAVDRLLSEGRPTDNLERLLD